MEAQRLAFDRAGRGEPLVLIHALGADRGVWAPVLPALTRDFDVITVDMPGFGQSSELPEGIAPTPAALAAAIHATLTDAGISRAHLAGISLGGWVALELAKLGALSVCAINPAGFWKRPLGPRQERARNSARAALPLLPVLLRTRRGRRAALAGSIGHPERVPYADALRIARSYATAPGFPRANAEMRSAVFGGFDEIDAPVTLAWGELDRLVRRPRTDPPGVRMVDLADCGHVPTWDHPQRIVDLIASTAALASDAAAPQHS